MSKKQLQLARRFARLMDNQFSLGGINFGLDTVIGLVPGLGDVVTMVFSFYLVWVAVQLRLPSAKIGEMLVNIFVDTLIGSVPLLGDIGDMVFKANVKNLRIMEEFADRKFGDSQVEEGEVVQE